MNLAHDTPNGEGQSLLLYT